ncbi:hypothetical protein EVAR_88580_1 [Eumeta japonica]|uniref:Uncharacterized protein n=1 Tax=Eumeta variegata TaxID=151549 RepID=A0A4C1Y982_EUMVA|nr:hypothetical protein EVAR_88580_1 [Eumeta japonica]
MSSQSKVTESTKGRAIRRLLDHRRFAHALDIIEYKEYKISRQIPMLPTATGDGPETSETSGNVRSYDNWTWIAICPVKLTIPISTLDSAPRRVCNFDSVTDRDSNMDKAEANEVFPKLSSEKIKAGIFDGPQVRKLINDKNFINNMTAIEKCAWEEFVWSVRIFLGNRKSDGYIQHVEQLLIHFQQLGCNKSIKLHYIHSRLDHFLENLAVLSEEQGKRFHQDIRNMEERYQGCCNLNILADYCWSIQNSTPNTPHARKSYKRKFTSE